MENLKCIILGGSGEVGSSVTLELIKSDVISKITMLGRREIASLKEEAKVEQHIVDTGSPDLENIVKEFAQGHDVAISCIGIGGGAANEEEMMEVEVNILGKFARGCKSAGIEIFELLTGVGIKESHANSRMKLFRVMGTKLKTVVDTGFDKLADFKPGMIVDNKHTSRSTTRITRFIPDSLGWGNIYMKEVALAFVAHLETEVSKQNEAVVSYGNKEIKALVKHTYGGK